MFVIPYWVKLALGFLIGGLLVLVIGVATPYWVDHYSGHFGLFTGCYDRFGCGSLTASDAIGAARAFEIMAILLTVVVIILLFVYLNTLRRDLHLASLICTFVDVGLIFIGVICFISERKQNLSWSFALTIIAAILILIAGVLLVIHRMKGIVTTSGGGVVTSSRTTRTVTTTVVSR